MPNSILNQNNARIRRKKKLDKIGIRNDKQKLNQKNTLSYSPFTPSPFKKIIN